MIRFLYYSILSLLYNTEAIRISSSLEIEEAIEKTNKRENPFTNREIAEWCTRKKLSGTSMIKENSYVWLFFNYEGETNELEGIRYDEELKFCYLPRQKEVYCFRFPKKRTGVWLAPSSVE